MVSRPPSLMVLCDGPEPAREAMARDLGLARALREGELSAIVARRHGWAAPALSFGRAQSPPVALVEAARDAGVELARRPTGGGWLLHLPGDVALTLAIRGPQGAGEFRATARRVARAIASGLSRSGIEADVLTGRGAPADRSEICFSRGDRDEVAVGAVKVAGVALARLGPAILVQTAIPCAPADGALEELEARHDPARGRAVAALAGLAPEALWEGFLASLAETYRCEPRPGSWDRGWPAGVGLR